MYARLLAPGWILLLIPLSCTAGSRTADDAPAWMGGSSGRRDSRTGGTRSGGGRSAAGRLEDGGSRTTEILGGGGGGSTDGGAANAGRGATGGESGGSTAEPGGADAVGGTSDGDGGGFEGIGGLSVVPRGFRSPCHRNSDCDSNWCFEDASGDRMCSEACASSCQLDDWRCAVVVDVANPEDPAAVCAPRYGHLCQPCLVDDECRIPGLADPAECVEYVDLTDSNIVLGSFCGVPCAGEEECPSEYSCTALPGASGRLCVKDDRQCECQPHWAGRGYHTTCERILGQNVCTASRTCTTEGLEDCSAPAPQAEVCNGVDDDCNGFADDAGAALCNDELPCTTNECLGTLGCAFPTRSNTCLIDGQCRSDGDENPQNPCLECDSTVDPSAWTSAAVSKSCNDAESCTSDDHCSAGACVGGLGQAQPVDAYEPNPDRSSPAHLGSIDDEATYPSYTPSGTFDSPTDVDWFAFDIDDICNGFLCTGAWQPKPRATAGADVQVCITYTCGGGNTPDLRCTNGSSTTIDGVSACCAANGVVYTEADCSAWGTDDDGTAFVRVVPAEPACITYTVPMGTQH